MKQFNDFFNNIEKLQHYNNNTLHVKLYFFIKFLNTKKKKVPLIYFNYPIQEIRWGNS